MKILENFWSCQSISLLPSTAAFILGVLFYNELAISGMLASVKKNEKNVS